MKRLIKKKGYLTGVEISRINKNLRDHVDWLQRMVGVENREISRQEEQGKDDGTVKEEKCYIANCDTVVGGYAGELLAVQRTLTDLMNVPEEKNADEYEEGRKEYD